jgi:Domain of unknown function (DUF4381)
MNGPDISKLHDFVQPAPPSWVPQTTTWYVIFAIAGAAALYVAFRALRSWRRNRYRRAALEQLAVCSPESISDLLKRTALAAWPREKVAALTGTEWLKFLDQTSASNAFEREPGNRIEEIAVSGTAASADEESKLRKIASEWIRRHRVPA